MVNTGYNTLSAPMDSPAREPEVVSSLGFLSREIAEVELMLGDLLRRLVVVTNNAECKAGGEPTVAYFTPLASEIGAYAERVAQMRNRLRQQLDSLELP